MLKSQKFSFIISVFFFTSLSGLIASENAQFNSEIFSYDNPENAQGLHVSLKGETWVAQDIKWSDLSFHQSIFTDPEVMAGFADGQVRTPGSVEIRFKNSIEDRFKKGMPHGLLTVKDANNPSQLLMHAVAGGGDRPGTAEIAYAMPPEHQGKKLGTQMVTALVQVWAPEVRRIGEGVKVDNNLIVKRFQCFGEKTLENMDATASPSNIASWKILDRVGFCSAQYKLNSNVSFDFDLKEMTYKELEAKLLELYDPLRSEKVLDLGNRYSVVDMDGKKRTFSKHDRWNRIKLHFEKEIN